MTWTPPEPAGHATDPVHGDIYWYTREQLLAVRREALNAAIEVAIDAIAFNGGTVPMEAHVREAIRALLDAPQESNETDELLRNLGLVPEQYRTDGGVINHLKVKAAMKHPHDYCNHEYVTAPASYGGSICKKCGKPL